MMPGILRIMSSILSAAGVEFVEIGAEESELIEALGEGAADADGGRVLREDLEARDAGRDRGEAGG